MRRYTELSLSARWFVIRLIVSSRRPVFGSFNISIMVRRSSGKTGFGESINDIRKRGSSC